VIQVLRDLLWRHACNELAEHAFHDIGLGRFDFTFACRDRSAVESLDDAIAVAETACRLSVLDPAT